jgi:hypothetical protein
MSENIQIPFYVRYDEWKNNHSLSGIWESLIWLEEIIPKLIEISWIRHEEIKVSIKDVKWWCITFGLDINLIAAVEIFKQAKELYDILNFIDLWELYKEWNEWSKENPLGVELILWTIWAWLHYKEKIKEILSKFLVELLKILPLQKDKPNINIRWKYIPTKIAQKAHRLVQKSSFKKTLKPVFNWSVENVNFSEKNDFKNQVSIDKNNGWDYLSDKEQIIPEWWLHWWKVVTGKFVGWQRKKWNSVIFRVNWLEKKYRDLVCYPDATNQMTITDFTPFLPDENLELSVDISRVTLYEKPKLIVHSIKNLDNQLL